MRVNTYRTDKLFRSLLRRRLPVVDTFYYPEFGVMLNDKTRNSYVTHRVVIGRDGYFISSWDGRASRWKMLDCVSTEEETVDKLAEMMA